jgi:2-polyprenyl-3-methyl-5-hydroxy-6-metoxy-1,4-benzoquinol methylase
MTTVGVYKGQQHAIFRQLIRAGLSSEDTWEKYATRTRDRVDVCAWRCTKSEVIILESTDHLADTHYTGTEAFSYWNAVDRKAALVNTRADDHRRADFLRDKVRGKIYLDVGTGLGGVLDLLRHDVARVDCVEVQPEIARSLEILGYQVFRDVERLPDKTYQVISLFHVLEHIQNPEEFLVTLRQKLTEDGQIYIEVPHARDALLSRYKSEAFKNFTLWSEHLVLHTMQSLESSVKDAGLEVVEIIGIQRYSLANHLYWLACQAPNGHNIWSDLEDRLLNDRYGHLLSELGQTDTLLLTASKG